MTTHSSSVAWRIPTDSKALQRVKDVTPHAQMQYFFFASVSSVPMGIVHGGGMVSGIMGTLAELTPQSLYSSFPPLCLLGDPHSCLGYIWLWQGLSVLFSFHLDCQRSAASLSDSNVSSLTQTIALIWGLDPASVPPAPAKVRSSPTNSPLFPPTSFVLMCFAWLYTFFSGGHVLLSTLGWCSANSSVSEVVSLMYQWRDMYSTSFYSSTILFSPLNTGFLFLLDSVMVDCIFLKIMHFFSIIQFMHIWTH